MLTFCNSSLYLRRGLSSSISVLDIDSLRDIGEVILPSSAMQAALFSDGTTFYTATISSLSTLSVCFLLVFFHFGNNLALYSKRLVCPITGQ